jgi:hypothetical protein
MEQSVVRVSKTLRDIDHINLVNSLTGVNPSEKSNQKAFIDDQCERAKTSLPLEFYARQLNHKRVFRQIIEVDEQVDFNVKNWKQAMVEYRLYDAHGAPIQKSNKMRSGHKTDKKLDEEGSDLSMVAATDSKDEEDDFEYDSDEFSKLGDEMNELSKIIHDRDNVEGKLTHWTSTLYAYIVRAA